MGSELIGIIPAAGRGTRMGQLGQQTPKALIEVDGITLLERAVESLKALDASRIVIVVSDLTNAITEFVNGSDFGIEIKFALQATPLGLAHAISCAAPDITGDFVVLCPDNVYSEQTDLIRSYELFKSHGPAFVLLTTVQPTHQGNRQSYYLRSRKKYAPNLFDYRQRDGSASGLAVNSTGCIFLNYDAIKFLPDFSTVTTEHIFRDYLETITNQETGLIYVLRGVRYDFSQPEDINDYQALMARLDATNEAGVSAILMNDAGQVLLQQRDDNPAIRYPGHWALFGGTIEDAEVPADAVAREVQEEIGFELETFGLFREFEQNNKREFAFVGNITANLDELSLSEGQGMNFFNPSELMNLLIRPDDRETLEEYFGN